MQCPPAPRKGYIEVYDSEHNEWYHQPSDDDTNLSNIFNRHPRSTIPCPPAPKKGTTLCYNYTTHQWEYRDTPKVRPTSLY